MSVAFRSPLSGKKRLFEEQLVEEVGCCFKRARLQAPPPDSCHLQHQAAVHQRQELLLRLHQMFPGVDEKTIVAALENLDNLDDLDAAIASLNQLKLAQGEQAAAGLQSAQLGGNSTSAQGASDKLSLAWLDHFLKEFYASRQPQEARMRVSRILEEFESAVIEHYKSSSQEMMAVRAEFEKMKKSNMILSKAVAVQHNKLQEAAHKEQEVAYKDQELQSMKELLTDYQEKLRTLELNNYTLAMHLQRATGPPPGHGDGRPPDVY